MADKSVSLQGNKSVLFTNRQLITLMWPLLLEQMLAIAVGLADSLMVATVGDAAISAVSLVDSISNLMIYIFSAMATGGAAVAGQYIGLKQKEDACNAGQQLIALLAVVSVFFVALLYLFRPQILTTMFGHIEPDVMAATNTYYLYVMASIPGIALYNGGAALFRTMGRSDVSLKVSLLMNGINVAGNAILIGNDLHAGHFAPEQDAQCAQTDQGRGFDLFHKFLLHFMLFSVCRLRSGRPCCPRRCLGG